MQYTLAAGYLYLEQSNQIFMTPEIFPSRSPKKSR